MAAVTVEVQALTIGANGSYRFDFKNGSQLIFDSLADVRQYVENIEQDENFAIKALIGWYLSREPNGGNPNILKDKACTVSLTNNEPIWVR